MRVRSYAKINLGIEILGKREDGYHEIRSLFQTIDFSDELEFKRTQDRKIILHGNDPAVPWDGRNLIYQAIEQIRQKAGVFFGLEIYVNKNIIVINFFDYHDNRNYYGNGNIF